MTEMEPEIETMDARAAYEAGSVHDSAGLEERAILFYQRALEQGLDEPLRGQLLIQTASTLRNLRRYDEGLELLDRLGAQHPLADSGAAVRALILSSKGDLVGALTVALRTLAPHLPRYQRSMAAYAEELPERIANGD
jgi:tetratricopeptide (TPR) repeat protein